MSPESDICVGDTCSYYIGAGGTFTLKIDTLEGHKYEYAYNDAEGKATIIYFYRGYSDDSWKVSHKEVVTLNKYGFIDENSERERYFVKSTAADAVIFEEKPRDVTHVELDAQGNWIWKYTLSDGWLSNFESRDITYY